MRLEPLALVAVGTGAAGLVQTIHGLAHRLFLEWSSWNEVKRLLQGTSIASDFGGSESAIGDVQVVCFLQTCYFGATSAGSSNGVVKSRAKVRHSSQLPKRSNGVGKVMILDKLLRALRVERRSCG